jgi:hypothetical protein
MSDQSTYFLEGVVMLLVVGLVAVGSGAGYLVGHATRTPSASSVPTGHSGASLTPADLGDATAGARLFVSKGCADCHSYGGKGGTDAPPLDFMAGHLSARDAADMSGRVWNHLPAMLDHFKEEGLPVPVFADGQMADLVAFLHSKRAATAAGSG